MNSLILYTLEWSPTQFVLQCDHFITSEIFFSLFVIFRTNIRMSIIYLSPCSFLFALHLDWSLNTSVDKKIKRSFCICEIVFYFSLWLKLSIFFSLILFFLEMLNRSWKKLIGKKLNVDRKIATHFPHFH